ncbi:adenosylcobinamide-phosphate synthase CbiB [Sphingomonas sp. 2R-10]|uniref:adenosylcobinamide-phosphate synthase CbiB n=1 Tax=Sphingomonas sp. 2R-10 TaxID=3045148 RepID=UPI000F7A36E2|nr:adenosylcobinamide-phosphate synthase CbiB [Sphingomonas sp. 2R-10]MDJ0277825.1 adenosylcobinamide-phosphate synthase CbiB [Sphingomonas sp. 2R-10]
MALAALIVEAAIGYPRRWWHPVMGVGALIGWFEARWNRRRRIEGVALVVLLVALSIALGLAIERLGAVVTVLVATTGLAQRSLHDHVAAVARPLAAGDLPAARGAVAMIVGRDTDTLDEAGVATAAIESLAESFCDGVVAPAIGFLLFGLPGLFAVKAINTADSMVGHRTPELRAFGWASARADDVVNFVPARLAGALVVIAGRGGWRTMWRDAPGHASPNGGWPEAAMAGALGRRLGGPVTYDGEAAGRAALGEGPCPDARDLMAALRIYRTACLLLWLVIGGFAWAR